MDDRQFRQLLDYFGLSWNGYRKVREGVKKRVSRHMQQLGLRRVDEFLSAMETNPELRRQMDNLMTVSVSRFFRDRGLWQTLETHGLPQILARGLEKTKVWSAGCACGEEAYSFRILWEISRDRLVWMPELELWATDMNPLYLEKAREGVYPPSSIKELSPEIRSRYFQPVERAHFAVSDSLKEGILWKVHNLLSEDPPQRGFQIIFLRNNLLTYYKDELKIPAFRKVLTALAPEGFLIIGAHEKIGWQSIELRPFPCDRNIFQKAEA